MRNGKRKSSKSYQRALRVLARMRRSGVNLSEASRQEHTDPRTVRKYVRTELKRVRKGGRTRATKSDRRHRDMLIPTTLGTSPVVVKGSRQATLLGRYMSAVGRYLRTGETSDLAEFESRSIGGHPLLTDPDTLNSLAEAGSLELERIYAPPVASS